MKLQCFLILRWYRPESFGHVTKTELHNFSDPSTIRDGQCSYLIDQNAQIHCAFVVDKSRVAPLKPVTVCSVRISQQIQKKLEYNIDEVYYWMNSTVVLGYINNENRRFHVFVSNRLLRRTLVTKHHVALQCEVRYHFHQTEIFDGFLTLF